MQRYNALVLFAFSVSLWLLAVELFRTRISYYSMSYCYVQWILGEEGTDCFALRCFVACVMFVLVS